MITSSSIPYISQMLNDPHSITDADIDSIVSLTETYPYFIPARYMEAAAKHKQQPFGEDMMHNMQLYMGNWIVFHQYMQNARNVEYDDVIATTLPEPADVDTDEDTTEEEALPAETASIWSQEEDEEEEVIEEDAPVAVEAFIETEDEIEEDIVAGEEEELLADEEEYLDEEEPGSEPENEYGDFEDAGEDYDEEETYLDDEIIDTEPEPIEIRAENDENLILPIYTEDYFLHQGIQVSNNIPPVNKAEETGAEADATPGLLMRMMSYSEWLNHFKTHGEKAREEEQDQKALKTMWQKEKLAAAIEEENEEIPENVFEMAVNSITKEESIASESLADIYVRQGKYDAAIDMYKKLSLRNPQKSAYFARKVEEIIKEK